MNRLVERGTFLNEAAARPERRAVSQEMRDVGSSVEYDCCTRRWDIKGKGSTLPTKMMIGGLPFGLEPEDVEALLTRCGVGHGSVTMPRDRKRRDTRGYAFINFESHRQFLKAQLVLHKRELKGFAGLRLVAEAAKTQ
mmetsp:Transcript_1821/g.3978  ORF Transcript_1821/g.3978 Transcript_1821/m.3978 type:complete len:138 (+) Transcript_1821:21-434(+)